MVGLMTPEMSDSSFCMSASAARGRPQLATYECDERTSGGWAVEVSFREELSGEPVGLSTWKGHVQDPLREQNKPDATVSD